jgi:hypothetical protein
MHVTIRRYHIHPGSTQQLIDLINEQFVPTIRGARNFIAYYAFDEGDGDVSSVSVFADEPSAQASNQIASDWVMKNAATLISVPPKIISGEVVAYEVKSA